MRGVSFIFIIFSRSLAAFRTSCDSHLNQTICHHFSYLFSIDVLRYIIIGPLRPSCLFPLQVAFVKNVNSCPVTVAILLVTNHIGLPTYVGRWHSFCLHIGISDLHIIPLLLCVWLLLPPTLGVPRPRYAEEDTVPAQSLPLHIRQTKKSIGSGLLSIFTRTRLLPFPPQFYTTLSKTRLILSPSVSHRRGSYVGVFSDMLTPSPLPHVRVCNSHFHLRSLLPVISTLSISRESCVTNIYLLQLQSKRQSA